MKRVVVTGMGVVSPLGNTVHDFWRGLLQGRSGIAALDDIELGKLPTRIGARAVGYDARDYFDHQEAHRMSRASQWTYDPFLTLRLDSLSESAETVRVDFTDWNTLR